MKIQRRSDCATLTARIPVSNNGVATSLRRSMGTPDLVEAESRANALAALSKGATADFETVHRLVSDVFLAHGIAPPVFKPNPLPALVRVRDLIPRYLAKRRGGDSYHDLCERALQSFWQSHQDMEVRTVIGQHVQDWADGLTAGRNVGTVRNWLGALSGFFRYAIKMGHATVNPCEFVELEDYQGVVNRLPMPDASFSALLAHLRGNLGLGEWITFALFGRYAGLRLQDAARVTGEALSFPGEACLLDLRPGKTAKPEVLPLFGPVVDHLREVQRPGLLTPGLARLSKDLLSRNFIRLCQAAGIDLQTITLPNGRNCRRISFHSLRHRFVTDLAQRGIPQELRKKMSAHVTDEAHERYDHAAGLDLHNQVSKYFKA